MNCEPFVEKRKDLLRRSIHSLHVRQELVKLKLEVLAEQLDEQGEFYFANRIKQIIEEMELKH